MKRDITRGTGNIFKDLGFPNAQEHLAKADLALQIIRIVQDQDLTQKEAAACIGAKQRDISLLKNAQLKDFSVDRLFSFLLWLSNCREFLGRSPIPSLG